VNAWPKQPLIYEINTWVWLRDLSRRYGKPLTLKTIPGEEWDALGQAGFDSIWLMGVWERSPAGMRIAQRIQDLQTAYRKALPDYSNQDVVGSPYAVHRYVVDPRLGGPEGLKSARLDLARRGIRLILDFVPNHVALDHVWVFEHSEYFIQGDADDLRRDAEGFFAAGPAVIAYGRDPYFPPWTDTAQLSAFHPGQRAATVKVLQDLSDQCDGVRCDMAMLLISRIFEMTWGNRAGQRPASEYWREVIEAVRRHSPGFLFLGEAYWDLEWELQQQGFDYCYDKRLYDRLVQADAEGIRQHLQADVSYQDKLVRFIENHDEPRATQIFSSGKLFAAAVAVSSLPGAKLFHEGQFEGRRVRVPVQLGRRPQEEVNSGLQAFYARLLRIICGARLGDAVWQPCTISGWQDNSSYLSTLAWCWTRREERHLIIVNMSDRASQGRVRVSWADLAGRTVRLADLFNNQVYVRKGSEMLNPGLYVDLPPWGFHFLRLEPA
jgi:hypothetical protein